jgi:hypothetical protein
MTQKLTDTMFTGTLASSKLTGALGSNDGSALTGVGGSGATISASDPTISTNPSGGVGTLWTNSTTGNLYCCTVATAGANVWVNIGSGFHGVGKCFGGNGPGTIAGFASGGYTPTVVNTIDKFTFGSSANATDVGDLTLQRFANAGLSSATNGYTAGGDSGGGSYEDNIDKFAFASTGNATAVGNLTATGRGYCVGSSSYSHGYTHAGLNPTVGNFGANTIDKFTFATDADATDHGDLTQANYGSAGQSSDTHGYNTGGYSNGPLFTKIDKFAYSSNVTATDHGDLSVSRNQLASHSSTTHGYGSGGSGNSNVIDKFAYSSNTTATDHGNLSVGRIAPSGTSSTTHGYSAGGGGTSNIIDKFAYSSNTTATDHGDLTVGRERAGSEGQQY